jgi:hypothetical protein
MYLGPQCFCCTILRDVIFVEACSASVTSMTCILQHAVVCWFTAAGIRAIALTLGWKPSKGIEPVESSSNGKEFSKNYDGYSLANNIVIFLVLQFFIMMHHTNSVPYSCNIYYDIESSSTYRLVIEEDSGRL